MTPTAAPRRLTRSRHDRQIGGVAGGLGAYLGVDPVLVRIAFAVMVLAGGTGILVYLAAWLIMPAGDDDQSSPPPDRAGVTRVLGMFLALGAVAMLIDDAGSVADFFLPIALIGVGVWLITRSRPEPTAMGDGGIGMPTDGAALSGDRTAPGTSPGATATLVHPPPAPPTPPITRMTLAALAIGAGAAGLAVAAGVDIDLRPALLVAVAVCGVGMIVGGFLGGAQGLAVAAVPLVLALSVVSALDLRVSNGIGERVHRPATLEQIQDGYRLGLGSLTVDLRDLDPSELRGQSVRLDITSGVGEVIVYTPAAVAVEVESTIDLGSNILFGVVTDGAALDDRAIREGAEGAGRLVLSIDLGVGEVDVR